MQKPVGSKNQVTPPLKLKHFREFRHDRGTANAEIVLHSFFIIDAKGNYVSWDDSFQQKTAVKPSRKGRINVIDHLVSVEDQPLIRKKLLSLISSGFEESAEVNVLFQGEKEFRRVMMTGRRIMIEGTPYAMCIILDIMTAKQTEDILNQRVSLFPGISEIMGAIAFKDDLASALDLRKREEQSEKNDQLSLIQCQKMELLGSVIHRVGGHYSDMLSKMLAILNKIVDGESINTSLIKHITDSAVLVGSSKDMINQLITFARSSAVMPIVFELNIFVETRLSELRKLIGENISLEWIPGRQKTLVKVDPLQIDELLSALCLNALDAITGNGRITIDTSCIFIDQYDCESGHPCKVPGHYVVLSVTDNGIGIDKKDLPFIFEPLFTTRADRKALGLGLSIAYGIAKQNHGSIDCRTEWGQGSTFTLYLPRYMGKNYFSVNDDPPTFEDGKQTVLLVEEEQDILSFYKKMLEKKGFGVVAICTPEAAITFATEHPNAIDLLLTNVVLREVNGCDLSQQLQVTCPHLKTLYMTEYHTDMTDGLQNEGCGFILKPFSMSELAVKINDLMRPILVLP